MINSKIGGRWGISPYIWHTLHGQLLLFDPKITVSLLWDKLKILLDSELNKCSGRNPAIQMCSARRHNGLKCILNLIVYNCTPSCLMHSKRMSFWMEMAWCSMQPSAGRESQAAGTKSVLECAGMCVFHKTDHTPHL